jgi:hypothetical protein
LENEAMTSETTANTTPALDEQLVRMLLHPGLMREPIPQSVGALWRAGRLAIGRAWLQHETYLRAEAERLHIAPSFPGRRFFGEACACGLPTGDRT